MSKDVRSLLSNEGQESPKRHCGNLQEICHVSETIKKRGEGSEKKRTYRNSENLPMP